MKYILAVIVAAVVFVGAVAADDKKIDSAKLVGKWKLIKSDAKNSPKEATIEFTKDNKLSVTAIFDGKPEELKGTYKVEGNKLTVTFVPADPKEKDNADTIQSLTDDKMILIDHNGKVTELARLK